MATNKDPEPCCTFHRTGGLPFGAAACSDEPNPNIKFWWASWYVKPEHGAFELFTPWWFSGMGDEVQGRPVCAAIKALAPWEVKSIVAGSFDAMVFSEDIEFRFVNERPEGWSPFTERFAEADWMAPYWARPDYQQKD